MRISDWSSDVCSSDLSAGAAPQRPLVSCNPLWPAKAGGRHITRPGPRQGQLPRGLYLPQGFHYLTHHTAQLSDRSVTSIWAPCSRAAIAPMTMDQAYRSNYRTVEKECFWTCNSL